LVIFRLKLYLVVRAKFKLDCALICVLASLLRVV